MYYRRSEAGKRARYGDEGRVWYNNGMDETITLEFDGGSRGNPGPAGIGVVVRAKDGTPLVTLGRFIGRATNNVAEYRALITAMEEAKKLGATKVLIRGDSELVVKQMLGQYRVKHPDMKVLDDPAPAATKAGDTFSCPKCGGSIKVIKPSPIRPHQLKPFICQCGTKMNG